jgi:hypothetical protein
MILLFSSKTSKTLGFLVFLGFDFSSKKIHTICSRIYKRKYIREYIEEDNRR